MILFDKNDCFGKLIAFSSLAIKDYSCYALAAHYIAKLMEYMCFYGISGIIESICKKQIRVNDYK